MEWPRDGMPRLNSKCQKLAAERGGPSVAGLRNVTPGCGGPKSGQAGGPRNGQANTGKASLRPDSTSEPNAPARPVPRDSRGESPDGPAAASLAAGLFSCDRQRSGAIPRARLPMTCKLLCVGYLRPVSCLGAFHFASLNDSRTLRQLDQLVRLDAGMATALPAPKQQLKLKAAPFYRPRLRPAGNSHRHSAQRDPC
jgi:hypothetical protein